METYQEVKVVKKPSKKSRSIQEFPRGTEKTPEILHHDSPSSLEVPSQLRYCEAKSDPVK